MDTKEVKAGEKYVFELLAVAGGDEFAVFETPTGRPVIVPQEEAEALYPLKGSLGTTPAPKYNPNRKFRSGDIVTPKERNGRIPWGKDMKLTVVNDEIMAGVSVRDEETGETHFICVLFLELVTPVEEMNPYCVRKYSSFYAVEKCNNHTDRPATHDVDFHPHAKEAAEAECKRLNEEYRKEKGNG